jgi:hypothetical protein
VSLVNEVYVSSQLKTKVTMETQGETDEDVLLITLSLEDA